MTTRFPLGFNSDPTPREYPSHKVLLAAPSGPTQARADMYRYRGPFLWQDQYGMCFPTACTRAEIMQRLVKTEDFKDDFISPSWGYLARCETYRALPQALQPKTLDDNGTSASELSDWYNGMGIVLNGDFPGPMTEGFNPSMVFNVPQGKAFQDLVEKAYDGKKFQLHEVFADKGSRVQAMSDLLKSFIVPILTWNVDSAYMRNQGQTVTEMNESEPLGGGHAETVLVIPDNGLVIVDNWWRNDALGIRWGCNDGTGQIDPGLIERMDTVRIFCLKPAVMLKGRAQ
jgi:hypothetical protein